MAMLDDEIARLKQLQSASHASMMAATEQKRRRLQYFEGEFRATVLEALPRLIAEIAPYIEVESVPRDQLCGVSKREVKKLPFYVPQIIEGTETWVIGRSGNSQYIIDSPLGVRRDGTILHVSLSQAQVIDPYSREVKAKKSLLAQQLTARGFRGTIEKNPKLFSFDTLEPLTADPELYPTWGIAGEGIAYGKLNDYHHLLTLIAAMFTGPQTRGS